MSSQEHEVFLSRCSGSGAEDAMCELTALWSSMDHGAVKLEGGVAVGGSVVRLG